MEDPLLKVLRVRGVIKVEFGLLAPLKRTIGRRANSHQDRGTRLARAADGIVLTVWRV